MLKKAESGCPYLAGYPGLFISISHGGGCAAIAIADRRVGVDVERIRPYRNGAAKHALTVGERTLIQRSSDPERMFFRLWTLKESYVKSLGTGLSHGLRRIEFYRAEPAAITCNQAKWSFYLREDETSYITSVCLEEKR